MLVRKLELSARIRRQQVFADRQNSVKRATAKQLTGGSSSKTRRHENLLTMTKRFVHWDNPLLFWFVRIWCWLLRTSKVLRLLGSWWMRLALLLSTQGPRATEQQTIFWNSHHWFLTREVNIIDWTRWLNEEEEGGGGGDPSLFIFHFLVAAALSAKG